MPVRPHFAGTNLEFEPHLFQDARKYLVYVNFGTMKNQELYKALDLTSPKNKPIQITEEKTPL